MGAELAGARRSISCRDAAGRAGRVVVSVRGGTLVLLVPPGESARLLPAEAQELIEALADGVGDALAQRGA